MDGHKIRTNSTKLDYILAKKLDDIVVKELGDEAPLNHYFFKPFSVPKFSEDLDYEYDIEKHFSLMKKQYSVCPEGLAKPFMIIPSGELEGYVLEDIGGKTLLELSTHYSFNYDAPIHHSESIINQLKNVLKKLHSNGYAHGDLTENNIILIRNENWEEDGKEPYYKLKLIDAIYIPEGYKAIQKFIDRDHEHLNSYEEYLNSGKESYDSRARFLEMMGIIRPQIRSFL